MGITGTFTTPHSPEPPDCDGEIRWQDCNAIATELQKLLPKLTDWYFDNTVQFIAGLHKAAEAKENVDFH